MTDQLHPAPAEPAAADAFVTETPLHAAAWLVQDLGVAMPPVPQVYLDKIEELTFGKVFGTLASVAELKTRRALEDCLTGTVWPQAGLAFGFVPVGTGGQWFYTLVGEQSILLISLRVSFYSQAATDSGKASISAANRLLERYLSREANYLRAISPLPPIGGALRRIVCYSNETGFAQESVAYWLGEGKPLEFQPQQEVFALQAPTLHQGSGDVLFRG